MKIKTLSALAVGGSALALAVAVLAPAALADPPQNDAITLTTIARLADRERVPGLNLPCLRRRQQRPLRRAGAGGRKRRRSRLREAATRRRA